MINKKLPMKILAEMQDFSKKGLIKPEERKKISDACKNYTCTGNDDEFKKFLDWGSENLSNNVIKEKFIKLKEEYYYDDSQNSR